MWDIEEGTQIRIVDIGSQSNDMVVYNKIAMSINDKYVEFRETSAYKPLKKVEAHDD